MLDGAIGPPTQPKRVDSRAGGLRAALRFARGSGNNRVRSSVQGRAASRFTFETGRLVIEIQELCKYYGQSRAVGPLSASIEKGEVVGLLGLNGAGKTTTLRILACDLLPSSGTVKVAGLDVVERPEEVRRRIGYLPDVPPLYDEMRVGEYLQFALELRGKPASEGRRRVPAVAERLGLSQVLGEPLFTLSHGFRQRVGIAQAVVHDPELVVLDEPISGLDPVQIVEMRQLVRQLGENHTVIVSSHILSEISETCDRLLVLRDGVVVASGTEEQLSQNLLEGIGVELTVRAESGDLSRILSIIRAIPGVTNAGAISALERGAKVQSFQIQAKRDVREQVGASLLQAGFPLLTLAKTESELEDVFIKLAGGQDRPARQEQGAA
jgi:ABC-2 type transport system ATP-binding protein